MAETPPESLDRKLLVALEAKGQAMGYFDVVVLFEGSPFDAVEQSKLSRQGGASATALAIGMIQDPAGLRTGSRKRANSSLTLSLDVIRLLGKGRKGYRENVLLLTDLGVALAAEIEAWGTAGLRSGAQLSGAEADKVLSLEVGNVEVLADPDGNFAARQVPLKIGVKRN